ncbi:MAG: hypothetical protein QNK05_11775 [Myxococcota bacterium]|nr:hypothetical protein [Myxococcota bacterium]
MSRTRAATWASAAILALAAPASSQVEDGAFETPPVLGAAALLGAEALRGPTHAVEPEVPTDGFMARFTIQSAHGTFVVRGRELARIRLHEIGAMDELDRQVPAEVFAEGMKEAAVETGQALGRAVSNPKETIAGIPAGVGRFFERTVRVGATGFQKIGDRIEENRAAGQEFGAEEAGMVAGRSAELAVDAYGRSDERRRIAKELRVDPYTTNEVLEKKLTAVANAAFAGSFGVKLATSMIPGGKVVRSSTLVSDWVWETPPGELYVRIENELTALGVPLPQIDEFLRHTEYSLTLQVALSAALTRMDGVAGRREVVDLALGVASPDQARFVVASTALLARHHAESAPLTRIGAPGPIAGWTRAGELVVLAPVDHLSWTQRLASRLSDPEFAATPIYGSRVLGITGTASDRARVAIQQRGWVLQENLAPALD